MRNLPGSTKIAKIIAIIIRVSVKPGIAGPLKLRKLFGYTCKEQLPPASGFSTRKGMMTQHGKKNKKTIGVRAYYLKQFLFPDGSPVHLHIFLLPLSMENVFHL